MEVNSEQTSDQIQCYIDCPIV